MLYLLETLFGLPVARVGVGMKLAREPAVGASDLILRGLFGYLENLVEIYLLHTLYLLRNYNFRGPNRLPVEYIASLEGLDDGTFLVLFGELAHNSLVDVRVEYLAV